SNIIPELQKLCNIYYSENFRTIALKDSTYFTGSIRLNNDIDMLEFDFGMEGMSSKELKEVFKALKEKKKYYRLKDVSFLLLENKQLEYMEDIFEYLNIGEKDFEKEIFSIPKYRAAYLDDYFKEKDLGFIEKNVDFKNLVEDIKKPEDI